MNHNSTVLLMYACPCMQTCKHAHCTCTHAHTHTHTHSQTHKYTHAHAHTHTNIESEFLNTPISIVYPAISTGPVYVVTFVDYILWLSLHYSCHDLGLYIMCINYISVIDISF